jgi:integrase
MNLFRKYKTFDEILPSFLEGKRIELKNKSYMGYVGKAKVFSEYLKENNLSGIPMRKLLNEDLVRFFNKTLSTDKKLDRPTVKKYFEAIKSIFSYALDMDEIEYIPTFKGLKFPPKGKDHSAALIPSEALPDLLDDIYEHDKQLYIATMLEYYCGVRPGKEARLIKVGAFNLKEGVLKIGSDTAKTGRARHITMADDLVGACREYGIEGADPNLYVFGKNKHLDTRPVSENMLRYRFNQYRDRHGLSKDVKLYTLKHQGCSELIKIADLKTIQDHLGHTNITSTAHYVKRLGCGINENIKHNFHNPRQRIA